MLVRWKTVVRLVVTFLLPVSVVMAGDTQLALAANCSTITQPGNRGNNSFTGGSWDSNGSPGWPWVSAANISSYNPSPVYTASSAWTMLTNHSPNYCGLAHDRFAQVGWIHWNGCSNVYQGSGGPCSDGNEHVFMEYTDNSGTLKPVYYYNVPSGSERYVVTKTTSGYYQFSWNEGYDNTPSSVNFGPAGLEDSEEVGDPSSGRSNQGSQWGGDVANTVEFNNLQWEDQNARLYTVVMPSFHGPYANLLVSAGSSQINSWFAVWDSRC